jgi:drug/metabolite transporter (DMT)-like permease
MRRPESSVAPSDRRATTRRGELLGAGLSAVMATLFAFVVIFGKRVQAGELPFGMLAIRFGGQALLLFAVLVAIRRPLVPARGERVVMVLVGTLGYATESALYFSALNHGGTAAVTLLFYTYPVLVMLVTIALDRRAPQRMLFVALVLALAGGAVVVAGGDSVDIKPFGIFLALCTACAYTAYLITTDRLVRRTDPLTAAAWLGTGAATGNLVYGIVFGALVFPAASSWPELAGMAVFSAGAFASMLAGLQLVGAVRNAIIGVMEPLTVAVLAYLFLDEPVRLRTAIGGVLILSGAVLAALVRSTHHTPESPVV